MKNLKYAYILFFVLLLAQIVSCDFFAPPPVGGNYNYGDWYITDEPPLKSGEFLVGLGSESRALTGYLAEQASEFFEVILASRTGFSDGAGGTETVYRTTFRYGKYGRMTAPALGVYDNTGDGEGNGLFAYIFAGTYNSRILLGVGALYNVDNGDGWKASPSVEIIPTTRRVQFSLQALTNDINTSGDDSSTFKPWDAFGNETDISKEIKIDAVLAPLLFLPENDTTSIYMFSETAAEADAIYDIKTSYGNAIKRYAGKSANIISREYLFDDNNYTIAENTILSAAADEIFVITSPYNGIRIPITITTAGLTGISRLSIDIPVVMLSEANSVNQSNSDLMKPVIWQLRGGLSNAVIDRGPQFNEGLGSMGDAVLIGVGILPHDIY